MMLLAPCKVDSRKAMRSDFALIANPECMHDGIYDHKEALQVDSLVCMYLDICCTPLAVHWLVTRAKSERSPALLPRERSSQKKINAPRVALD